MDVADRVKVNKCERLAEYDFSVNAVSAIQVRRIDGPVAPVDQWHIDAESGLRDRPSW